MSGRVFLDPPHKASPTAVSPKERRFPSGDVRRCLDVAYGRRVSNDAYRNWRGWAGVGGGWATYDQFCFLLAIAVIRRSQRGSRLERTELERRQVVEIAESLEIQEMVAGAIAQTDSLGLVCGRDLPAALEQHGYQISRSSLYRLIHNFSQGRYYRLDKIVEAIA